MYTRLIEANPYVSAILLMITYDNQELSYHIHVEQLNQSDSNDNNLTTICDADSNKAIRDGRPRPPHHQVGWDIPLHFDTNPESLRPFVPEIWPNNVFNLSATYDLDL